MFNRIRFILRFIKTAFSAKGFNARLSHHLNKAGRDCITYMAKSTRDDIEVRHFESCIAHILGMYSAIISYHDSISYLCLSGHGLNSSVLLRSQLEAYLMFAYFIKPKNDLQEVEKRVDLYLDWVMVRMYINSKKSQNFDLFASNPEHEPYLIKVQENYERVKKKYESTPEIFKELERSSSFLKDKKKIAQECDLEDLYQAVFSETSATVHLADISDRMQPEIRDDFEGYSYRFNSPTESMMISGVSNLILLNAIGDMMDFFEYPRSLKQKILWKVNPKTIKEVLKEEKASINLENHD